MLGNALARLDTCELRARARGRTSHFVRTIGAVRRAVAMPGQRYTFPVATLELVSWARGEGGRWGTTLFVRGVGAVIVAVAMEGQRETFTVTTSELGRRIARGCYIMKTVFY